MSVEVPVRCEWRERAVWKQGRDRQKASSGIPPTLLSILPCPGDARKSGVTETCLQLAWPCGLTAAPPPQDTNLKTINGDAPSVNLAFQLLSSEVRVVAWEGQTCLSFHNPLSG